MFLSHSGVTFSSSRVKRNSFHHYGTLRLCPYFNKRPGSDPADTNSPRCRLWNYSCRKSQRKQQYLKERVPAVAGVPASRWYIDGAPRGPPDLQLKDQQDIMYALTQQGVTLRTTNIQWTRVQQQAKPSSICWAFSMSLKPIYDVNARWKGLTRRKCESCNAEENPQWNQQRSGACTPQRWWGPRPLPASSGSEVPQSTGLWIIMSSQLSVITADSLLQLLDRLSPKSPERATQITAQLYWPDPRFSKFWVVRISTTIDTVC